MKILPSGFIGLCYLTACGLQAQTALINRAFFLNGRVEGSIQQMTAENTTFGGGASVTGDLFVPGTPVVQLNGAPTYGGTIDGLGAAMPSNYKVTLNGSATLRHVVRRTDIISLPTVTAPPSPTGLVSLKINSPSQIIDWSNLRDLTLGGAAGPCAIPPGNYGDFTANGGNSFILGIVDSTQPTVYSFQHLKLNASSRLDLVGPVIVTVANEVSIGGDLGSAAHLSWLKLAIASGGLIVNSNACVYGYVTAPSGVVVINGKSQVIGGLVTDGLTINGNGLLKLIAPPSEPPSFHDADHDGMDDNWESAHGLNPLSDDANFDNDRDGVANIVEFQLGLKPDNPDSDGDGIYDGDEIALGRDPAVSSPDTTPPAAPTELAVGAFATDGVVLSWQPASDDLGVSGYIIYRDGQPVETDLPIRGTTFTDTNLPDGEEFTYQVRAFDFAGNLSPLGVAISIKTVAADADGDGLPDEWEQKYFADENALPEDDVDGDGLTNLQEFQSGSNPKDFYNGVKPIMEALNAEQVNEELAMKVRKPDCNLWSNAPVNFDSSPSRRKIAASSGGPFVTYQLQVRTGSDGIARCYLEPLAP